MFAALKGYTRLATSTGRRPRDANDIPRYSSDLGGLSKPTRWTQKRVFRWGLAAILVWVTISIVYLHRRGRAIALIEQESQSKPDEKPKGEFDECPALVPFKNPPSSGDKTDLNTTDPEGWSRMMLPSELMERLDRGDDIPTTIIHQSWKTREIVRPNFRKWSADWRRIHGEEWIYVLWTDQDNLMLTEKYYPEYLHAYKGLPREIFRADMVRNMYMHLFGGVYADLDLVPLSPLHEHIPELLVHSEFGTPPEAYVGQMGDLEFGHSIPNAFMVSTRPGHPFWKKPLDFVRQHWDDPNYNSGPEGLTGPVALRSATLQWLADAKEGDEEAQQNPVKILDGGKIYPLSWAGAPPLDWCLCRLHSPWFDQVRCNELYPHAWTITYWTHSW